MTLGKYVIGVLVLSAIIAACREKNEGAVIEGKEMAPNSVTQPVLDTNTAPAGSDLGPSAPIEGPAEAPSK